MDAYAVSLSHMHMLTLRRLCPGVMLEKTFGETATKNAFGEWFIHHAYAVVLYAYSMYVTNRRSAKFDTCSRYENSENANVQPRKRRVTPWTMLTDIGHFEETMEKTAAFCRFMCMLRAVAHLVRSTLDV